MSDKFELKTIGKVRSDKQGYYIEIFAEYENALIELEGFSHINVLWWAHLLDDEKNRSYTTSMKPYKNAPEKMGLFATRSPIRPNPIGLTITQVLSIEDNIIRIAYIDAEIDTPILDIKPYHSCTDRVRDMSVPEWCSHWPQYYEDSAEFNWDDEFENAQ